MNHSKRVVSFSNFKGSFFGHGGEKRTKQIEQIVASQFTYQLIQCPFLFNKVESISLKSKIRRSNYIPKVLSSLGSGSSNLSVNGLLKQSYRYFKQERFLTSREHLFAEADAIIWENNFPDFFSMAYLIKHKYSKKLIACPHNLESLIPFQKQNWIGKSKTHFLEQEVEILQICDEVFTISEEEQWLLNLFGVPAKYLPYYPIGELFESLLNIRKHRTENEPEQFFLILGSINNPPTRNGMITLLQRLNKISTQHKIRYRFKVTGYGTEQLSEHATDGNIDILGYSEDLVLDELMRNCKAIIVDQGYSTGALTKIPEMLVAGIPVIVNNGAARSYRRILGVSVFDSVDELAELISAELPMPPIPPEPENSFKSLIHAC